MIKKTNCPCCDKELTLLRNTRFWDDDFTIEFNASFFWCDDCEVEVKFTSKVLEDERIKK